MKPTATRSTSALTATSSAAPPLICPLCGKVHRAVSLAPREHALCLQCGGTLATGAHFGPDTALSFAITGLILALPAGLLPIVTVGKLGNERIGTLFTSVDAMYRADLRLLAVGILICGALAPLVLLGTLTGLLLPARLGRPARATKTLRRIAHSLERWAMPEVQVLAVLVAFTKLGSLVDVKIGAGLWCYAAMSVATLIAWRTFDLEPQAVAFRRATAVAVAP